MIHYVFKMCEIQAFNKNKHLLQKNTVNLQCHPQALRLQAK